MSRNWSEKSEPKKTERLRNLRLAEEAADREKNPFRNGRDEAQHAIKE